MLKKIKNKKWIPKNGFKVINKLKYKAVAIKDLKLKKVLVKRQIHKKSVPIKPLSIKPELTSEAGDK